MISKTERIIAFRYLKPKKKEGFLKIISIFSFTGIALGVAILIIVMSVMSGFRTELINKILGFNPHIIVKPYSKKIYEEDLINLEELNKLISKKAFTFSGQAILLYADNTTGVLIRSYHKNNIDKINDCFLISMYNIYKHIKENIIYYDNLCSFFRFRCIRYSGS